MSSEQSPDPTDLASVLERSRRLIRRGDGWEAARPIRLWKHCLELGITTEPSITIALRTAFSEIGVSDGHIRDDESDEDLCRGQTMYEFRWQSASRSLLMYLKFCLFDGRLVIISFHRSIDPRLKKRGY